MRAEFEIIVADLRAGTWSVIERWRVRLRCGGNDRRRRNFFNGAAGAYTLTYKNADETRYYISACRNRQTVLAYGSTEAVIYTDVDPIIENDKNVGADACNS